MTHGKLICKECKEVIIQCRCPDHGNNVTESHGPCDKCAKCKNPDCADIYPHYGVAPHTHDLSGGSFIGSTRTKPKDQWPENFVEDAEAEGCGTYYCPDCLKFKPDKTK